MRDTEIRSVFVQGLRDSTPFILVIGPFGLLFGVLASEAGWNLVQIFSISFIVVAGASQFAALQLINENAPFLIIVGTGLAVNLRMAIYSASLAPHFGAAPLWQRAIAAYALTDQTYGVANNRFTAQPGMSVSAKLAFYFGAFMAIFPVWCVLAITGAMVGSAIPPEFALDFAAPITFIALFAPALRSIPHVVAALVSVTAALLLAWMPYNLWMVTAAVIAMCAGAGCEMLLERRSK